MIGVFDSGIGGLNILRELEKRLPGRDFLYYGDSKNCPYGEKTDDELMAITSSIVMNLKERGCKVIVIACNTATTRCMKKLKQLFPELIFIGTVPAIKVACDKNSKNTLVLATPATIDSERTEELVRDYKRKDQEIYLVPCEGLAAAIENKNYYDIKRILNNIYDNYKDKNIDAVVLGCTHYPNVKKEIQELFKDAQLLDGGYGVAKETKRQICKNHISGKGQTGKTTILDTL